MKPGLIITITPMKPAITADHRCKPTFSFKKKIDKIVTIMYFIVILAFVFSMYFMASLLGLIL